MSKFFLCVGFRCEGKGQARHPCSAQGRLLSRGCQFRFFVAVLVVQRCRTYCQHGTERGQHFVVYVRFGLMRWERIEDDCFRACQTGCKDIVKVLLEHGADGRHHPVTKYSPLYIACHYGHRDIVEMLLLRFPELIQVITLARFLN